MSSLYDLGPLRLDTKVGVLTRAGTPLPLGSRAVAVLAALVENHAECVSKAQILDAAWPDSAVMESNLAVQIRAIRKVLAQVPGGERWIETLPWRGYRFVGPVSVVEDTRAIGAPPSRPLTNLAPPATSFVGRMRERDEILHHLQKTRLVTLVGAGGIGKTRLGLELAGHAKGSFPDGAWLVELASIADESLVVPAVARVLGIRERGTEPLADTLCEHLRLRHLLLVLDNCEQARAPVAALVDKLLDQAPQAAILATSREPLGLVREHPYHLEPLSLPSLDDEVHDIARADAVQLFMARARQQQPDFALTPARAAIVAQVCIDLDGLPLALELAAARMHTLSIEQIGARLGDRFRLLTSGAPQLMPRQQTLRAAMDWSYDPLAEDERTVLRRMAVFMNGCTAEAVAAVTTDPAIDAHAAVDVLARLVRRSLVNPAADGGSTRYRLLETTRAYALEKLDEAGETTATRRSHAEYYRSLFAAAYEQSFQMSDEAWSGAYSKELENVRAAIAWAFDEGDARIGTALVGSATHLLLSTVAQRSEARGWVERALARSDETTSASDLARMWLAHAVAAEISSLPKVNDTYARAIELLRQAGDRDGLAHALVCGAYSLVYTHRLDDAEAALAEAGPLLEGTSRTRSLIAYFGAMSGLKAARDDVAGSLAACERAINLCRGIGADRSAAMLLSNLGDTSWLAGDLDRAQASLREAITVLRRLPGMERSTAMCICLINLVGVLVERGSHGEALEAAHQALPLARDNGLTPLLLDHLALRAALGGRYAAAARIVAFNDAKYKALGTVRQRSEVHARERLDALLAKALPGASNEMAHATDAAVSESDVLAVAFEA